MKYKIARMRNVPNEGRRKKGVKLIQPIKTED